jgi:hypothetical protein
MEFRLEQLGRGRRGELRLLLPATSAAATSAAAASAAATSAAATSAAAASARGGAGPGADSDYAASALFR